MEDKEIIQALECCASGDNGCEKGCPLNYVCTSPIKTMENLIKYALDLINRLQAENERLKEKCEMWDKTVFAKSLEEWLEFCNNLKAEAYKEFAEKFKKKLSRKYTTSLWKVYCEEIDNLLKELVNNNG